MNQLTPLTDEKLESIFDQELTTLFGGNITMGIMEAVRAQILEEGIEKTEARKNHDFVENLIKKFGFSDEQAATAADVTIGFVKNVRKQISSRK